jgi:adenine-specific DNA methylase
VGCKNCRATIPLLKTRWLCKKDKKRVVLELTPKADKSGIEFSINNDAKLVGQNAAARREHDKRLGAGTMSRSGAKCPCCPAIMTMEDIRLEGRAGRLSATMTAVVVDGLFGKEYRLPSPLEVSVANDAGALLPEVFADVPFGLPSEATPRGGSGASRAFSVDGYGIDQWQKMFLPRQLLMLGTWICATRALAVEMAEMVYPPEWVEAVRGLLACAVDRLADYNSTTTHWQSGGEFIVNTFQRFALPISWDFSEVNILSGLTGSYEGAVEWISLVTRAGMDATVRASTPIIVRDSAIQSTTHGSIDVIVTDPPYYDAIPYSDLMDFFYVWLRRTAHGLSPEMDDAFNRPLGPKWDTTTNDGELIDDSSRFGGDKAASKKNYEDGMARAFGSAFEALRPDGRFVVVFAHKHPDAWETLVGAIIRAGFVVDGSWPIQTERAARSRSLSSAALSSSVWLVCRKRSENARAGWDNRVLEGMHQRITTQLREFWDAGIRGPDFVWAATGPALEAYSQHPVVKKANSPGELMSVTEFLQHVRRIVVDFVVGRVLSGDMEGRDEASGLDDVTTYYLLHRHDFGFDEAPVGACILYAVSCGLSDRELSDQYDLVSRAGGDGSSGEFEEADGSAEDKDDEPAERSSGSALKLRAWNQRKAKDLGLDAPRGKPVPLIDQVHRIMR